ncbi:phosphate ABC transporter permease PstA [Phycicoccus endophyticus]|uniref:Phosphate transport system permease protein PstA n=1 Tax=Phycicoccus endophyticus TaxID=1690220 RepID=A0A7G9R1U7_9MICO|nr:phosphate ABC transporter permease PstA [Phycicoccus endophyticus]NHI18630.1 phosphate ABC transporter permease PstA [Phycicoccus endophyticus]QNN49572.1 phosphate ABC transporter permease PstA [Phycicoccus endophyticus]GGL37669.1 phosphate transport system permease protein PstA [Phycicoccus endophyticus]
MSVETEPTARQRKLSEIEGVDLDTVRASSNRQSYIVLGLAVVVGALLWLLGLHPALAVVLAFVAYLVIVYAVYRSTAGSRVAVDQVARGLVLGAFVLALVPLVSLLWTVIVRGGATVVSPAFLGQTMNGVTGLQDQATQRDGAELIGGAYHAIIGTLIITGLAALISVPIGVFTAIFLVEYQPKGRVSHLIRFLVDVMTGIPSIVAGLFAFALWAVLFGIGTKNGFAGAVALSVLMISTVVRNSEEMLRIVPNELREASLALGVPKWRTIAKVVLPTAASGLASGITLAIARVIGETAPLLVAVGYARGLNVNPAEGPMNTLAVYAYYMFTKPLSPGYREPSLDRAWAAALLLVLIVVVLNLSARFIARAFAPKTGR